MSKPVTFKQSVTHVDKKSTEWLVKEKDKVLLEYAKDSGLKLNEVKEAIDGFKRLHLANPYIRVKPKLELNLEFGNHSDSKNRS